jgi:CubicO group peptidase (beta-lactamase class C family)
MKSISRGNSLYTYLIFLILAIPLILSPVQGINNATLAIGDYWPTDGWRSSNPEDQGMNSTKLVGMEAFVNSSSLHPYSMIVIRNGYIVHEKYFVSYRGYNITEPIYSCTVSVMSALIGIAINQGYIDNVSQTVLSFFPDKIFANPDPRKNAMTIENLLTMTHGLDYEENADYGPLTLSGDWIQFLLDKPMIHDPGTIVEYCSGAPHILSAILQNITGMTTAAFAETYLFEPLGITDYEWDVDNHGINDGGRGLSLTPHDMAKFGYLYINNGTWDTDQIIPADWVHLSGQGQFTVNSIKRYGMGWWNYTNVGAYNAVGFTARVISVLPEYNLVVVMTGYDNSGDFMRTQFRQALLDWIIPATQDNIVIPSGQTTPPPIDLIFLLAGTGVIITIVVIGVVMIRKKN